MSYWWSWLVLIALNFVSYHAKVIMRGQFLKGGE